MTKRNGSRKPPSRKRYEEEHPTISLRLDRETKKSFKEHLAGTGCSSADFVKDALGRERSMIEKRVEILASRQLDPSKVEERLRYIEALVFQAFIYLRDHDWSPICPRCGDQDLLIAWGDEIGSTGAHQETATLRCPKCGYFLNTPKGIDPKSIKWSDLHAVKLASKPKPSPSREGRKRP